MMGKTHLTIGIATALAVCQPKSAVECLTAVMGGAIGGVICDIDCRSKTSKKDIRDISHTGEIVFTLVAVILLVDGFMQLGICSSILQQNRESLIAGIAVIFAACLKGSSSEHRTFTHSFLFIFLFGFGVYCIHPPLVMPFAAGGLSHLFLDLWNKKPVQLMYPFGKKGVCFRVCYSGKTANLWLMWLGLAADVLLLGYSIYTIMI